MKQPNTKFPWSQEDKEAWAKHYASDYAPGSQVNLVALNAFLTALAKAEAEFTKMIEASPKVFRNTNRPGWMSNLGDVAEYGDTKEARLVNIQPIEKEEGEQ